MNIFDLNGAIEYLPAIADDLERSREIGGDISISFPVPKHVMNEHVFSMLSVESKIELPDGQVYTIKDIKETLKGRIPYKTIQAQHEFFDIIDKRLPSVGARNGSYSFASMVEWILKPTGWKYTIEGTFYSKTYENWFGNSLKLFQDLISDHSAEFWPDSKTKTVAIKKVLGKATDAQIRWGHNLKTINQSINTNNLSTCIKAYGKKKADADKYKGDAQYMAVGEYKSPTVAKWGERWAEEWEDERYTSNATLLEAAAARIVDEPEVSLEAEYVELRENGQNVHDFDIGDDVYLIVELLNVDVRARALKIVDYPLSNGHKSPKITISNIRKNIKDIMASTTKRAITAQGAAQTASKQAKDSMETASAAATAAGRADTAAQTAQAAAENAITAAERAVQAAEGKAEANHTHNNATTNQAGFMSAEDKQALNRLNGAIDSAEITSLANGWAIDPAYGNLTINKTAAGEIYFTGRINSGTPSESTAIFTLAERFRSDTWKSFSGASPGQPGIIDISPEGLVFIDSAGEWISLENVRYNL